ncbi:rhomboid family intramembrane serine protease [Desulfobacula sp.]|uniref:rhomboid family intramembrane serine protease n=1 Tax=Desulfobacula sp. TaxID=2593537 RepID=UPI0025BBB8A3|nr:rhomboid family intramembrane serine protease [Desulfobacula sp.]MBC2704412.1 rhomboid family intramembrane serine protease [Desulfobacula sp.]
MIPIRDNQPSNCFPVVTYLLMGINLLVFILQIQTGLNNEVFFYYYGLVPAKYTVHEMSRHFSTGNHLFSIFSYMFLHGGFLHFIGNMWTLYIFGDNVEDHFGSLRFLGFYLICGIISGLFHFFLNPVSMVPTIGASGAIAGVMGAYFLLYPKSRILTIIPIIIIPLFVEIPAFIFLGVWFLIQFFNAAGANAGSGIAWWAHIGGFIAGLVLVKLNKKLPKTGTKQKISQFTAKKHTPRLQMIVASGSPDSPDLYGNIDITSMEAIAGTNKMVTIPWGFYKPLYKVKIPSGVKHGTRLRLSGMGKSVPDGIKGDMYLTVNVKNKIL